jgi:DNA-binding MarR family transcriptional regulator
MSERRNSTAARKQARPAARTAAKTVATQAPAKRAAKASAKAAPAPARPRARVSAKQAAADSAGDANAAQVLRQFRQVFNAVKTHFQRVERSSGLGGAQMWALNVVQSHPDMSVTELSRELDIHQSTASNLVKSLVDRGLVASVREGADRRVVRLRVLPAGNKLLKTARGPFTGVLPAALKQLDAATLRRLQQDLGKLIAVLGVDKRAGRIPLADW